MASVLGVCGAMSLSAFAQELTVEDQYLRRLKVEANIQPLEPSLFGEQVNMYTGDLTFSQNDIVLEGIGPSITLTRDLASLQTSEPRLRPHALGDWMLSVPRIETLTDAPMGTGSIASPGQYWVVPGAQPGARCTQFARPLYKGQLTEPESAWFGMDLVSESGERQGMLERVPGSPAGPAITGAGGVPVPFTALTIGNWQIGCLPATANGQAGEAFLAVSPEGTRYYLNHLVGERASAVFERVDGTTLRQYRMFATMYVTRVEDRFGNYLSYQYSGDQVTSISASDGRNVSITWRTDSPVISQITVNPGTAAARTWQYQYDMAVPTSPRLVGVVRPDGTAWQFNLNGLGGRALTDIKLGQCATRTLPPPGGGATSTLVHPSGAVGTFVVQGTWHTRSYVPSICVPTAPSGGRPLIPVVFGTKSLISKTVSGPGMAPATWTYAYSTASGSTNEDPCAANASCSDTKWVDVTGPQSDRVRHTFSTRWNEHEGKVVRVEHYQGSNALLRTEIMTYANANAGPYPNPVAYVLSGYNSNFGKQQTWHPLKSKTTVQDGRSFTITVDSFDVRSRPIRVTKTSAPAP